VVEAAVEVVAIEKFAPDEPVYKKQVAARETLRAAVAALGKDG
jgi:hypothetical protein